MRTLKRNFILLAVIAASLPLSAMAGPFYGGFNVGYTGGLGIHATGTFMDFTRDLPLSARLTLGYNSADDAIDQPDLEVLAMMGMRFRI